MSRICNGNNGDVFPIAISLMINMKFGKFKSSFLQEPRMATVTASSKELSEFFRGLQKKTYLCDVTFIVGEEKTEVYGIRSILAARSR